MGVALGKTRPKKGRFTAHLMIDTKKGKIPLCGADTSKIKVEILHHKAKYDGPLCGNCANAARRLDAFVAGLTF